MRSTLEVSTCTLLKGVRTKGLTANIEGVVYSREEEEEECEQTTSDMLPEDPSSSLS